MNTLIMAEGTDTQSGNPAKDCQKYDYSEQKNIGGDRFIKKGDRMIEPGHALF
jgi:hypothetical protein